MLYQETESPQASALTRASPIAAVTHPLTFGIDSYISAEETAPVRRWWLRAQEAFVQFTLRMLTLLLGGPVNVELGYCMSDHLQKLLVLDGLG